MDQSQFFSKILNNLLMIFANAFFYFSRTQSSRSISFFPKNDEPEIRQNNFNFQTHQSQPQFFQQPQYPSVSQQEEQFKFSNKKRIEDLLNANEIFINNNNIRDDEFPIKKYRRIPPNQYHDPNVYSSFFQKQVNDNYQQDFPHSQQQIYTQRQQPNIPHQYRPQGQYQQHRPYAGQFEYNRPGNFNPSDSGNYYRPQSSQPGGFNQNQPSLFGNILNAFQSNEPQGGLLGGGGGGSPQNFFNNIQNNGGNFGGQLGKALDDISKNDDYQCVPKLLCQMVGNPRGQSSLPSFVNAPTLTA